MPFTMPSWRGTASEETVQESLTTSSTELKTEKPAHNAGATVVLGEDAQISEAAYQNAIKGEEDMRRLGWKQMAVLLIVESIALGSLSLPSVFATVGMVAGVIIVVGTGLLAAYACWICAEMYHAYEGLTSYAEAGRQLFVPLGPRWTKVGYEVFSVFFVILLVCNFASHTLTGAIMWQSLTERDNICSIAWVAISAIFLVILALPPTFHKFAWLGYIDFASIVAAILITMIATGVSASNKSGGLSAVDWSAWPQPGTTFVQAFGAVTNVVFAYAFVVVQFTIQAEMTRPRDITKSIWAVVSIQIVIYTLTGALIYAFVGKDVQSPALLSAPTDTLVRIAFGIALPVIFISGSINGAVVARYVHGRMFATSRHRFINTGPGWLVWILILVIEGIVAFCISEAIPFFNSLLGLIASLFLSGFCFYIPPIMWFCCIRQGSPFARHNLFNTFASAFTFLFGVTVLGAGTYSAADGIKEMYSQGSVRSPFSCAPIG